MSNYQRQNKSKQNRFKQTRRFCTQQEHLQKATNRRRNPIQQARNNNVDKPFTKEITELLAGVVAMFHVVVEHIKAIVLLPLKQTSLAIYYASNQVQTFVAECVARTYMQLCNNKINCSFNQFLILTVISKLCIYQTALLL